MTDSRQQHSSKEEISLGNQNFDSEFRKALQEPCNQARSEVLNLQSGNPSTPTNLQDSIYLQLVQAGKKEHQLAA